MRLLSLITATVLLAPQGRMPPRIAAAERAAQVMRTPDPAPPHMVEAARDAGVPQTENRAPDGDVRGGGGTTGWRMSPHPRGAEAGAGSAAGACPFVPTCERLPFDANAPPAGRIV